MLVVNRDVSLRPLNTMDVDGTLRYLVEWETAEDLGRLFTDSTYADVVDGGVNFIGQGSNLLFVSRDYRGALAKCASRAIRLVGENDKYADLEVSAGVALDDVVAYCCRHCLWGLENLSLIPGTAGGAAVQNVGAYGVEFKDVVVKVNCYDRETHRIVSFDVGDIGYAYRDNRNYENGVVVHRISLADLQALYYNKIHSDESYDKNRQRYQEPKSDAKFNAEQIVYDITRVMREVLHGICGRRVKKQVLNF